MILTLVSETGSAPVSLSLAKQHLRIEGRTDDDTYISSLISVALSQIEEITGQDIRTKTWDLKLREFPVCDIRLPRTPVASVTSVSYVDQAGETQTVSSSVYSSDLSERSSANGVEGPRVYLNYNESWPVARYHDGSVTVRFVTGYTSTPEPLKQAMLLLVSELYQMRSNSVSTGAVPKPTVIGVNALVEPYKRLYR